MPRKPTHKDAPRYPYSYKVTLSCGHRQLLMPDRLPNLDDKVPCSPCQTDSIAVVVDRRELEVYCPDCDKVVDRFHILATLSADTKASVHNVRDKRGHHASVRVGGDYLTNGPVD